MTPGLQVITGVETDKLDNMQMTKVAEVIERFALELNQSYGIEVSFDVRCEKRGKKLHHARYLVTDQVVLLIERGFDLLCDGDQKKALEVDSADLRVRDVSVSIFERDEYSQVEAEARKLRTLKQEISSFRTVIPPSGLIRRASNG